MSYKLYPGWKLYLVRKERTGVLQLFQTGITHTHTQKHSVALSKLDRFLWRSTFFFVVVSVCFIVTFDYHICYNRTTTYTIYHYYSSLFLIISDP